MEHESCVWTLWRFWTEESEHSDTYRRKEGLGRLTHLISPKHVILVPALYHIQAFSLRFIFNRYAEKGSVGFVWGASFRSFCTCISSCVVMRRRRQQSVERLRLWDENSGWGWGPVTCMHGRVNTSIKILCRLSWEYSHVSSVDARLQQWRWLSKRAPVVNPVGDRRSWVKSNGRSISSCGLSTTSTSKETPICSVQGWLRSSPNG